MGVGGGCDPSRQRQKLLAFLVMHLSVLSVFVISKTDDYHYYDDEESWLYMCTQTIEIKLEFSLWLPHEVAALMKSKSWMSGLLMLMCIKWSNFTVISLLRRAVLIRFIVEKALSHSAVLTGRTRTIAVT